MISSLLSFLLISFGYSLFEKLQDPKGYKYFLTSHLKKEKLSNFFWYFLVLINSFTLILIILGLCNLQGILNFPLEYTFYTVNITLIILLIGQRIAGDFQGAANLGIYFLINITAWYLHTQC